MAKESYGIDIVFRGETVKFDESLQAMNKLISATRKEVTALNKDLKLDPGNIDLLTQKYNAFKTRIEAIRESNKLLKNEQKALFDENGKLPQENAAEWARLEAEITKNNSSIRYFRQECKNLESTIADLRNEQYSLKEALEEVGNKAVETGDKLIQVGNSFKGISGASYGALSSATKAAMDFESAFIGVQKTVDETDTTKYEDIEKLIRNMAQELPTSATEIANIMEMAGQLGIKADDLGKFTKVIVDLGNATNVTGEEGAKTLAQLYNIMQGDLSTVDRFGAALTALGNNSATTEAEILNMSKNLAAMAKQVGLSEQDLLGLSTALASTGLSAERGGSAMSTIFRKVAQDIDSDSAKAQARLQVWADTAGMTVDQFREMWKGDTISAIKAMIGGLAQVGEEGGNLYQVLSDLGVSNIRQIDSVTRLANSYDNFDTYLKMANEEWSKNSALTIEANRRYNSTESQLKILKNTVNEMAIGLAQDLLPVINEVLNNVKPIVQTIGDFVRENNVLVSSLLGVGAAMSPVLTVTGNVTKGFGEMVKMLANLKTVGVVSEETITKLTSALGLVPTVGLLGAVTLVGLGIGLLIKSYTEANDKAAQYQKTVDQLRKSIDDSSLVAQANYQQMVNNIEGATLYTKRIDELVASLGDSNLTEEEAIDVKQRIQQEIDKLNTAIGQELYSWDEEKGRIMYQEEAVDNLTESYDALREAMKRQAWLDANYETYTQAIGNYATAIDESKKLQIEALNKSDELASSFGLTQEQAQLLLDHLSGNIDRETFVNSMVKNLQEVNGKEFPDAVNYTNELLSQTEGIGDRVAINNEFLNESVEIAKTYEGVQDGTIENFSTLILGAEEFTAVEELTLEQKKEYLEWLIKQNEQQKQNTGDAVGGYESEIEKTQELIDLEEERQRNAERNIDKKQKRTEDYIVETEDRRRREDEKTTEQITKNDTSYIEDRKNRAENYYDDIKDYREKSDDEITEHLIENDDELTEKRMSNDDDVSSNFDENTQANYEKASTLLATLSKDIDYALRGRTVDVTFNVTNPGALNVGSTSSGIKSSYRSVGSGGFGSGGYNNVTVTNHFTVNSLSEAQARRFSTTIINQVDEGLGRRYKR